MPSSWGKKLEKKLNGLTDTASKESIQTLSNWIAFNRKHVQTIATALTNALQDFKDNDKRQWLLWQLINEILVREKGNAVKWEKLSELRLALGEALQPAMKLLGSTIPDQLDTYLEEWEEQNVFGGPSLNAQLRRLYQSRKNLTTTQVGSSNGMKTSAEAGENASTSSVPKPTSTTSAQSNLESSQLPNEKAKSRGGRKEQSTNDDISDDVIYPGSNDDAVTGTEVQKLKNQQGTQSVSIASPSSKDHGKSTSERKRNSSLKEQAEYDFESKVSFIIARDFGCRPILADTEISIHPYVLLRVCSFKLFESLKDTFSSNRSHNASDGSKIFHLVRVSHVVGLSRETF